MRANILKMDNGKSDHLDAELIFNRAKKTFDRIIPSTRYIKLLRRPVLIEFSGTPKAGKTSTITSVRQILHRSNKYELRIITERASLSPITNKPSLWFNSWCSASTLAELIQITELDAHVVFLDRGLFDCICWYKALNRIDRCSEQLMSSAINFLSSPEFFRLIDKVFLFKVDAKEALDREARYHSIPKEYAEGNIMTEPFIKAYNEIVLEVAEEYKNILDIEIMDTTGKNIQETALHVANEILDVIESSERVFCIKSNNFMDLKREWKIDANTHLIDLTKISKKNFFELMSNCSKFCREIEANETSELIQLIPMAFLRLGDKILVLKRKEKEIKDELHDKYTILCGGHMREEDTRVGNESIPEKWLIAGLLRELNEELALNISVNRAQPLYLIHGENGNRQFRHMCVVYEINLKEETEFVINEKEHRERLGTSLSGRFKDLKSLPRDTNIWDPWALYVLKERFDWDPDQPNIFS